MKVSVLVRVASIFAVFGAVACAQAQINIYLASVGTATEFAPPTINSVETVVSERGGAGLLSSLTYSFDANTGAGTGVYTDPSGAMLDFSFALNPASVALNFTSESVDADWSYTGGTLGYTGLAGGGTLTFNYLIDAPFSAESGTLFSGLLAPEPAPLAVIGLGVIGLLARRRRKS